MWLHSLKVARLLRSATCLHTNQSRSYLNHLVRSNHQGEQADDTTATSTVLKTPVCFASPLMSSSAQDYVNVRSPSGCFQFVPLDRCLQVVGLLLPPSASFQPAMRRAAQLDCSFHSMLCSAHTVYLCVLCGSQNKQRLSPYTTINVWFL